jgi:hypothetical protein
MLADKVKIGTLYDLKAAIQWWAIVLIPGFSVIADVFHTRVSRHIHMTAADLKLPTEVRAKNILTDSELELFFAQIMRETQRVASWKQTYVACVLAYITAARPGSFLVTKGYSQGAPMGGAGGVGLHRAESHTLRWKDIEWIRELNGIAANITFRFAKGHQDRYHKTYINSKRDMFLAPKCARLFLDLSLLLFGLAVERGLFIEPLDQLLNGNDFYPKLDRAIGEQAVFAALDTNSKFSQHSFCMS